MKEMTVGQAGEWQEEANFREGHLEIVFSDMYFSKPYFSFPKEFPSVVNLK